jgi:maleate cis-trans isomerase
VPRPGSRRVYRIGLLAPFRELPGELGDTIAAAREEALHWQVITAAEDSHAIPALRATGDDPVLRAGVERMLRWRPDVVVWVCTSGSFVDGKARALEQVARLEAVAGVPATSTSLAFAEALAALDIAEVAVIAPYPEPATARFVDFLGEWGVEVANAVHMDYPSGTASEQLRARDFDAALVAVGEDLPIVIPDTAVWGLELYPELASRLSVPLLVANQVTLWHAFQLAGMSTDSESFGALRGCAARGITRSSAN